ncbi:MAG: bifunctional (p)ppGpp synthetase/guanosine-3',5'-bis(diphosphate) 3'-pyrophosphohydrolase [Hyphomicrobiaceae bacterium]|nr:bifunctional (p)ppGpp synthetase/guanosine-3',5'-bis(diphosphate) 3'-pyrophosphohydrolase [Hyphomicrobiaceae bacterium]
MMRQFELVDRVKRYNPQTDESLLNRAYVYGMMKHGAQKRASGDPYFSHPLEVAAILTDLRLDDATIAVALLHDTIEDTDATREEIDKLFGVEIGQLVDSLTKLRKLDFISKKTEQAENFRRLLLAIADDVRVLLVKLADRLHNMRTLGPMREDKRHRIAEETMEIYAPLAGRMGMQAVREELEELSFKTINPVAFEAIQSRLSDMRDKNRDLIPQIEKALTEKLLAKGIHAQVKGREKKAYSIFTKMQRKSVAFEQLSDIYGFRVIVRTLEECYRALGAVHTTWSMVPDRFKDYISTPKSNDYRSIHTTVIGPGRQRVELQIRTEDMHGIAEFGIAAHALYKEGDKVTGGRNIVPKSQESRSYGWLRETLSRLNDPNLNPEEFVENTKLELFHDQVFCFTPKGKIIALPRGATPIDFAYAVHTNIGNSCVGCKINGKLMPLMTELKNGDECDIIRAGTNTPPAAWEQIATTGKARAAIRRATRDAVRKQFGALGKQIVERAFSRAGKAWSDTSLEGIYHRFGHSSIADLLAAVGRGDIVSSQVVKAVYPDYKEERAQRSSALTRAHDALSDQNSIPIRGNLPGMPIRFAPEGAVPGDRIVGIITPGEGITVYPIQSPALESFDNEPERWVDLRWDIEETDKARFPAVLALDSVNEPGSLAQIATVIAEHEGNIENIRMLPQGADSHRMIIDLGVWDLKHLSRIMMQLRAKPFVSSVQRVNG